MSVTPPSRQRLALLLGSVCVLSVLFASPLVRAVDVQARALSTLLFEENFTSDNSTGGKTAPSQAQLSARGWKDGVGSLGRGYKFEVDSTLNKNVMYAHWSTVSAGGSDPKQPDDDASAIKHFFPASREVTMYAMVKFHNVEDAPKGAHWVRFFNNPAFSEFSPANMNGQMDLDVSSSDAGGMGEDDWLYDPTTKQALPNGKQYSGFYLYSGGSLSYASKGKDSLWRDDTWYEVVWYLKNSTTGTGPTGVGDGQMRVYVRPYNTTAWTVAFDGQNFVNTLYQGANTNAWMIGPYMERWTNDIRHYFSRLAVWAGDAYSDGTLATFLGTPQPDTTPPTVSMTAPSAGSTVSGTVTVSANATDAVRVTSVQFQLNGANLGPEITSGTDSFSWNTTSVADGGYTLTAIARDAAGNTTTSAPLNVTVKNAVAPQISGVSTSNVSSSSATIGWQTDQAADTQVEYGPTASYGSLSPLNTSMVSVHSASLSGLSGSTTYHFRVKSKNSSNRMSTSGDYSFVTAAGPDTMAPSVTMTSPANGATVQVGQSVTLTMSATDNVGVTSSGFKVDALTVTSPVSFSTAGAVTIVAWASDAAGNVGTASVTINVVAPPPPSPPPPFTISNVASSKVNTTTYAMTWTTSVGATGRVEYGTTTSYGQFSALDPDMETSHYEEIFNLRSYTTYHYRVISKDAQGRTVVSGDRTFTTGGWWRRW